MTAEFKLGRLAVTPGALALLKSYYADATFDAIITLTARHAAGDWGTVDEDDAAANNQAVKDGDDRILSAYRIGDRKLYIITEVDRSVTTLLLPEEY